MADPIKSLDPPDDSPEEPAHDDGPDNGPQAATGASMGDRPLVPQDDPEPPDDFGLEEDDE